MAAVRAAALALAVGAAAGCGGGKHDVRGVVTAGGQPVPRGVVWFEPAGGKPGPQGMAYVTDGKFDTAADGRAVEAGEYLVRVEAFDGKAGPELPYGKPLPNTPFETKATFPAAGELAIEVPAAAAKKRSQSQP